MSSTLAKKVRYVKDRCINAYWMLRTGKFTLIFKSLYVEVQHRVENISAWVFKPRELDDSQVPGSGLVNKCKVVPPSYRPTRSQTQISVDLQADSKLVARELRNILTTLSVPDGSNV
jgi:hypothetical protein